MPDDKSKRGPQDRAKINKNEPYEVGYAARKLGTSPAKIHEAIKEVGPGRKKVEAYVRNGRKA
jgi:hypothetical protein